MEALLGASQSNSSCGSVADLQAQLRELLSSRVTETRADHTSVTFEIRATAVFDIPVTQTENEALESASNIDPLLGGVRSSDAPIVNGNGELATRRVKAIDTLVNQPTDDPVLQTSTTRHIIASLMKVDRSTWIVRQISRNEQGWAFTYICKNSWQAWSRQASKNPAKTVIAEWSEKGGQDPIHLARPAFDCRGSVKIAFVKSTKTIDVKYEHTPMHKTVAELIELLAPPPVAPIIITPAKKVKEPKPPKEPKPKTPRPSKKRVGENSTPGGEGSEPKKRRKKKASGAVLPPEMPGALPVGDASTRRLYNGRTGTSVDQAGNSGSYPQGLVGVGGDEVAGPADGDVHAHSILNLPPGEAARRRETAISLLRQNNIDPETLSAEQFNIFANQSPELQRDSLAMLIKYGAERLRIVHPDKSGSSSGQNTPAPASQSTKPKKSQETRSEVEGAEADEAQGAVVKQRTRICDHCRISKYKGKCDRARPSCSMCVADGVECVYRSLKLRQSKAGEAAPEAPEPTSEENLNHDANDLASAASHTDPASRPIHRPLNRSMNEPLRIQEQSDGHAPQNENVLVSEPMAHQAETPTDVFNQTHTFYQHSSGLSFPHVSATDATEHGHSSVSSTTAGSTPIEYMSNSVAGVPETTLHSYNYSQPPTAPKSTFRYGEQTSATVDGRRENSGMQPSTSRRSLPTDQSSHENRASATAVDAQSTWQPMSSTPTPAASTARSSPRQSGSKKPTPIPQAYDDLRQHQASSWVNTSQSVSDNPRPTHNSPLQLTAAQPTRVKSRQSNRAQSHTPVNSTTATRQAQPQGADNSAYVPTAATQQSSSTQSYNAYNQYQSVNTQAESSSDRAGYQPYPDTQTGAQSATYSSFDDYNNRLQNTTASAISTLGPQNVASSYPSDSTTTSSAAQWGTTTPHSQGRNARAYKAAQPVSGNAPYNMASDAPQAQSLQGLNMRPQASVQVRGSSSTYSQQLQQQQQRQQQGQQQQGYNGYMNQQQQAGGSQQTWYGFGATPNNASSSGYNSAAAAAGAGANSAYSGAAAASHGHGHGHGGGHGHQAQHHRSMNLSSHTYSSMDGDQSLYDLLRSNPAG